MNENAKANMRLIRRRLERARGLLFEDEMTEAAQEVAILAKRLAELSIEDFSGDTALAFHRLSTRCIDDVVRGIRFRNRRRDGHPSPSIRKRFQKAQDDVEKILAGRGTYEEV